MEKLSIMEGQKGGEPFKEHVPMVEKHDLFIRLPQLWRTVRTALHIFQVWRKTILHIFEVFPSLRAASTAKKRLIPSG